MKDFLLDLFLSIVIAASAVTLVAQQIRIDELEAGRPCNGDIQKAEMQNTIDSLINVINLKQQKESPKYGY